MHAEVLAVAAIGVGIEVADEGAFDGGAGARGGGKVRPRSWLLREARTTSSRMRAGLGVADGGSGGVADGVDGGLGLFAEADDEEPLGLQAGGGMQQQRLVGAGFVFAAGQDGCRGGADGFVAGQQDRLGLGVGALGGLGVDGGDGEEFGFDLGEGREREFCTHTCIIISLRSEEESPIACWLLACGPSEPNGRNVCSVSETAGSRAFGPSLSLETLAVCGSATTEACRERI